MSFVSFPTLVVDLIEQLGVGSLGESWRHQPGTPAYYTELNEERTETCHNEDDKENAAHVRDLTITKLIERATLPPASIELNIKFQNHYTLLNLNLII